MLGGQVADVLPVERKPRVTVLLVDDDADIRLIARSTLTLDGRFEVVGEGADGAEAVELARRHVPDVVLLDLEMPWLDGAEAVPHIRRAVPRSLIALWTVAPESARAADALELGASVLLDKSFFSARELGGTLWDLLVEHRSPRYDAERVDAGH